MYQPRGGEANQICHFEAIAEARPGILRGEAFEHLIRGMLAVQLGIDHARTDGVHGDAELAELLRGRVGSPRSPAFDAVSYTSPSVLTIGQSRGRCGDREGHNAARRAALPEERLSFIKNGAVRLTSITLALLGGRG